MLTRVLKAKLHHARVTRCDPDYHGSITIDADLLRQTGLLPNEAVLIADCENGNRFETYVIEGPAGSGVVGINGAAALLTRVGNRVIVMSFVLVGRDELPAHSAKVLVLGERNQVVESITNPSRLQG
jgi:aspartate 1-decarboxylase